MGVVQYGEKVVHEFKLSDYKSVKDVVKRAQSIHQRGGEETNTALGINVARYYVSLCGAIFGHTRPYFAFSYFASLNSSAATFPQVSGLQTGRSPRRQEGHDRDNRRRVARQPESAASHRGQREGRHHPLCSRRESVGPIYSPGLNGSIFFFYERSPKISGAALKPQASLSRAESKDPAKNTQRPLVGVERSRVECEVIDGNDGRGRVVARFAPQLVHLMPSGFHPAASWRVLYREAIW